MKVTKAEAARESISGEDSLSPDVRAALQQVGAGLDEHRPLRVRIGGVVVLGELAAAKEQVDEGQGKRGSAAGSRQGAARRQGPSGGSRSTGAPSRVGDQLRAAYEKQKAALSEAYPSLQVFPDHDGMWLLAQSAILDGLAREATFLVALPFRPGVGPRAWAFWHRADSVRWIGPRHTNFGDGSICAFSPGDSVWRDGGNLTTLLDLYSVWTLRQLHLEIFGRWPGKQYAFNDCPDPVVQAHYRERECKDDELCGCGSETRRYAECCKPSDLTWDITKRIAHFQRYAPGGFTTRRPPAEVAEFIGGLASLPRIADVHLPLIAARSART